MPGEEAEAARPGDIGAGLVVACPFVAVEAVLGAGINANFDIGPLGSDRFDVAERNARVFFSEMKLGRNLRRVVGEADDGAAVIADRRGQA